MRALPAWRSECRNFRPARAGRTFDVALVVLRPERLHERRPLRRQRGVRVLERERRVVREQLLLAGLQRVEVLLLIGRLCGGVLRPSQLGAEYASWGTHDLAVDRPVRVVRAERILYITHTLNHYMRHTGGSMAT